MQWPAIVRITRIALQFVYVELASLKWVTHDLFGGSTVSTNPPLYTFAVIADSHIDPVPAAEPASRSNLRNAAVVEMLNELAPDFVIHCGDIVHAPPFGPYFHVAAEASKRLYRGLQARIFSTPGNQDIGDKPLHWMPAPAATMEWTALYEQYFGPSYQAFEHKGCQFLFVNSPIMGTGSALDLAQRDWLASTLARLEGQRIFLTTHYPPYLLDDTEPSSYDNLDPAQREWLLALIDRYAVEAVFTGHVHNFFYNRRGPTQLYVLPSTAFVRRDYADLLRVAPGPESEFGRNEPGKLGFFLVDVLPSGHRIRYVRTGGATGSRPLPATRMTSLPIEGADRRRVGVTLRHAWAETLELPSNSTTDEFVRKRVRSDYAIEALWHLGVVTVRIPIDDLRNPVARERLAVLRRLGHRVGVFTADANEADCAVLREFAMLVDSVEVVSTDSRLAGQLPTLQALVSATGIRVWYAALRTSAEARHANPNYPHFQGAGFSTTAPPSLQALRTVPAFERVVTGLVFRADLDEDPVQAAVLAAASAASHRLQASLLVAWNPPDPGKAMLDDERLADRVAMSAAALAAVPGTSVVTDTFADIDRGYYPRLGLVDRRCDPRAAGRLLRWFHEALEDVGPGTGLVLSSPADIADWWCAWRAGSHRLVLYLRRHAAASRSPADPAWHEVLEPGRPVRILDLDTGVRHRCTWADSTPAASGSGGTLPRRALLIQDLDAPRDNH